MAQTSRFWDRHAKGYAKRPVADEAAYRKKLQVTQDYLEQDMEVLELACGTGTTAIHHAPFVKHILAVDISRKMIEIAQAKAVAENVENVIFEQSSIVDLSVQDATYDVVMAHSILHLLESKEAVIAKTHRMLKPGGAFVSSTFCPEGMMSALRVVLPIGRFLGLLPLIKFFTAEELVSSLKDAGFRIDQYLQPGKGKAVFIVAIKA